MKITIEPSKKVRTYPAEVLENTVIIESADDDLNIQDIADLVRAALVAYGFSAETVRKVMPE